MRDYNADHNLIAVSANLKEIAINTPQTLDTTMLLSRSDVINLEPRRETNEDEQTGFEEPDLIYKLGALSGFPFNFEKAQPQHFGFVFSFGLGLSSPAAWGSGYKHTITPLTSKALPFFTGAQRLGDTVAKRRFSSLAVDSAVATFGRDAWAKLTGSAKGTGKHDSSITSEQITAAYNVTALTLAANKVAGATAADRLASVHRVRVLVPATGEWQDVTVTAVSDVKPAVLTITKAGEAVTPTTFEVLYAPEEAAWCTFPARINESPLRVTDLVLSIGGKWNGTTFLGGHSMSGEIESVEYSLNNAQKVEYRIGGTGEYASFNERSKRVQTIKLNREMRDYILQRHLESNETFGVYMKATGAEFETGKNYYVEFVFPKCGVITAPVSVNNDVVAEAGDLRVLRDSTYGSVRVEVANLVSGYAQ